MVAFIHGPNSTGIFDDVEGRVAAIGRVLLGVESLAYTSQTLETRYYCILVVLRCVFSTVYCLATLRERVE